MEKGFNFNIDLCVACHACVVGCTLENNGAIPWRRVLSDDLGAYPDLPVHNISMACNHCKEAPCLKGCPVNAYYRDEISGAVMLDADKCIGCNYCFWTCPYDAPHYNKESRAVEKCHLCSDRVSEGFDPACVTACPTGALSFGELKKDDTMNYTFPDAGTEPGFQLISSTGFQNKPEIIPEPATIMHRGSKQIKSKINIKSEWSLVLFTYLSSQLVALNISNWFGTIFLGKAEYILAVIITMLIPLLHLGKPKKAWRSISGIVNSPLSQEIAALLLFSSTSIVAYIFDIRQLWIISFISGIFLLIAIDSVYTFTDRRISFKLHPGQVFLSGLLVSSFLLNAPLPFMFIVLLKLASSVNLSIENEKGWIFKIFILISAIFYICISLSIYGIINLKYFSYILLLIIELVARLFYYIHFRPESVVAYFFENNLAKYEKSKNS